MFWAKNKPVPDETTDFGEMVPVIWVSSTRFRSAAVRPSCGTRVDVVVGGIVVVVVVDDVDVVLLVVLEVVELVDEVAVGVFAVAGGVASGTHAVTRSERATRNGSGRVRARWVSEVLL